MSDQQAGRGSALEGFETLVIGLRPPRPALREAVVARTRAMLAAGLVEEVRALVDGGLPPGCRALQSIGYRQAVAVVRGELSLADAERSIVTETMRLAKRQLTWFRHQQPDTVWFEDPPAARRAALAWLETRAHR